MFCMFKKYKTECEPTKVLDTGGSEGAKAPSLEVTVTAPEDSETALERALFEDTTSETGSDTVSADTDYDGMYSDSTDSNPMNLDDMDSSESDSDSESQIQSKRFECGNSRHKSKIPSFAETFSRAQVRHVGTYTHRGATGTTTLQYQRRLDERHPKKNRKEPPRIASDVDKYVATETGNNQA